MTGLFPCPRQTVYGPKSFCRFRIQKLVPIEVVSRKIAVAKMNDDDFPIGHRRRCCGVVQQMKFFASSVRHLFGFDRGASTLAVPAFLDQMSLPSSLLTRLMKVSSGIVLRGDKNGIIPHEWVSWLPSQAAVSAI